MADYSAYAEDTASDIPYDDDAPARDYDRLTRDEIFAILEERRTRYARLHREMEIDQDWIYAGSTHESHLLDPYIKGFPEGFAVKVLPLAEMGVAVATDSLMVGEVPTVSVALPEGLHRNEVEEQKHKDELKEWCEAFLFQVNQQSVESPWRDFIKKGFGLGYGIISYAILWDKVPKPPKHGKRSNKQKKAWAQYEHERKYAFPFDVKSVHPLTIFPDPDNDPPYDYIEEVEVDLRAVCRKYPHLLKERPEWVQRLRPGYGEAGAAKPVKRVTYISKKYFAQYIDGVPLGLEGADNEGVCENPSGYLWLRMAHSGYGEQDHKGRLEYRVKGLVRSARDTMASYITNWNVMEVMRQITAFPPLWFRHDDTELAQKYSDEFTYGPAQKIVSDRTLDIAIPPTPAVPPVVFQSQDLNNQLIQLMLGPDILRGQYRNDTAAGQKTRLRQAQMPYQAMQVATEQTAAGMLTDILCAIRDEFDGPVTVWAKRDGKSKSYTLDPKRIPPVFQLTTDLTPPTQEERDYILKENMTKAEAGWITRRQAMAEAGIPNPDQMLIEIMAEQIMGTGPIQEHLANASLEKYQQRVMAEEGVPPAPPMPMQGAPGAQPGMTGGQALPPPAAERTIGAGGFTLDEQQPEPVPVDSPFGPLAGNPFQPLRPDPPPPMIRG